MRSIATCTANVHPPFLFDFFILDSGWHATDLKHGVGNTRRWNGETYTWEGRGRDMGVTVMNPGDKINISYNPKHPREISTLALLRASTGNILAVALAFLAFYVWFFWLRPLLRRSSPDDVAGDVARSFADRVPERIPAINKRLMGNSLGQAPRATFGKR
jgi:hypothetical protein